MNGLFPPSDPERRARLEVSGGHRLYYELCGSPAGEPAVFLHGGPGSCINAAHRRFFDPAFYRVVLFDQRGCGQSTPRGAIAHNTLWDLVEDLERLRLELDVSRWMLFGGSWGSTLALAYAQAHPRRVSGMVLRGLFLASRDEMRWYLEGLRRFLPEAWQAIVAGAPDSSAQALLEHYAGLVFGADAGAARDAARRWSAYESALMAVGETPSGTATGEADALLDRVRVQLHYLAHDCFLVDGQLLDGMAALAGIPAILVQGRCDLACPPLAAYTLAHAWPGARLRMVENGGHSALYPAMADALVQATEDMKRMLGERDR